MKIFNLIQYPTGKFGLVGWNLLVPESLCIKKTNAAGQSYWSTKVWESSDLAVSDMIRAGIPREQIKVSFNRTVNENRCA